MFCSSLDICYANHAFVKRMEEIRRFRDEFYIGDIFRRWYLRSSIIRWQIEEFKKLKKNCTCCECGEACSPCLTWKRQRHWTGVEEKLKVIVEEEIQERGKPCEHTSPFEDFESNKYQGYSIDITEDGFLVY
jgi:hypothetical protein